MALGCLDVMDETVKQLLQEAVLQEFAGALEWLGVEKVQD